VYHLTFRGCTRLLMDPLDWGVDRVVDEARSRNRVRVRLLVRLFYIDVDVDLNCYACCIAFHCEVHHFAVPPLDSVGVFSLGVGIMGNISRPFFVNPHSNSFHLTVISNSSFSLHRVKAFILARSDWKTHISRYGQEGM
jgi:hypothetical protein